MPRTVSFVLVVAALAGCPPHEQAPQSERCTAFGQRCTVAPGKFGTCVIRDNCTGPNCFDCQSQH